MGKYEFFEGQSLSCISWDLESGEQICRVGSNGVVGIKISIEHGQMAGVPWAVVFYDDGTCLKHNLALVSTVKLALNKETPNET